MRKELGKITKFEIGMGGYDDAMFGLSVTFMGKDGWGVSDFTGTWTMEPTDRHKWTRQDQTNEWAGMCRFVIHLMQQAKVNKTADMVGIPVEVTFEGNKLSSWRVLEEVL